MVKHLTGKMPNLFDVKVNFACNKEFLKTPMTHTYCCPQTIVNREYFFSNSDEV